MEYNVKETKARFESNKPELRWYWLIVNQSILPTYEVNINDDNITIIFPDEEIEKGDEPTILTFDKSDDTLADVLSSSGVSVNKLYNQNNKGK